MNTDEFEPLEMWELRLPAIPERSTLYPLEPIGVGTPNVESLTSYVIRLSYEHCLTPSVLLTRTIAPFIKPGYVFSNSRKAIKAIWGGDFAQTNMLYGTRSSTAKVTEALKQLTRRSDLHALTMSPWGEVIASMGLFRHVKAWCPICYEQWRSTEQVIYEPLIWALNSVTVCPHHHTSLLQKCHHCCQTLPLLIVNSLPVGYCSKCGGWLGITPDTEAFDLKALSASELNWQLWGIDNIGELLATAPSLSSPISRARIKEVFSAYIIHVTNGNVNAFSRLIDQADSTVHSWFSGINVPKLNLLLVICYHLRTSLLDFLTKKTTDIDFSHLTSAITDKPQYKPPRKRRRLNRVKAQSVLQAALHELPPPSLKEVVKRLNTKRATLDYWFLDLCRAISVRHVEYKKNQYLESARLFLEAVIAKNESPPPSLKEVARRFGIRSYPTKLHSYFPEMCNVISERYLKYQRASSENKKLEIRQQVRQIAIELHNKGVIPSSGNISKLMTKPSLIIKDAGLAELQLVRRKLGYEK